MIATDFIANDFTAIAKRLDALAEEKRQADPLPANPPASLDAEAAEQLELLDFGGYI